MHEIRILWHIVTSIVGEMFFFFFLDNASLASKCVWTCQGKEGWKKWISSTAAIIAAQHSFSQSHMNRSGLHQIREFLLVLESIRKLTFLLWFFSFWEQELKNNTCEILRPGYNKF